MIQIAIIRKSSVVFESNPALREIWLFPEEVFLKNIQIIRNDIIKKKFNLFTAR